MRTICLLLVTLQLDSPIAFRSPSDFRQLPETFRAQLERSGCQIPQPYDSAAGSNVISGSFARKGQKDWAVLCSLGGRSHIVVYWGGSAPCPADVAESEDKNFLQKGKHAKMRYSRALGTVRPSLIRQKAKAFEVTIPFKLDHEGIEDFYWGKASGVLYCHDGKWHQFPGSD
jgi:hypothetical protein